MRSPPTLCSRRALTAACAVLTLPFLLLTTACQYDRESRLAEIRVLQETGRFDEAIAPLRVLLTAESDHPEANYRLGVSLVQTGRPSLAIWPLQKATQSQEYVVQAGLLLATTLLATDSFEESVRAADKVLAQEPDRIAALYTRGRANIEAGRPDDALVDADHMLELQPDHYMGATVKVAALIDLERFDEAEKTHLELKENAEKLGNTDSAARACAILGRFYASQEQMDKATETILGCLEEHAGHSYVQQYASDYFIAIGEPDRSIDIWRAAVERTPEDITLRTRLADLLFGAGETEKAEAIYKETVELFDTTNAWQLLSFFYRKTERPTDARKAIEKALERSRKEPPSLRFALADILIVEGEFARAEQIASSLQEPSYRMLLRGSIKLAKGDPAGALKLLESGLRLWPNSAGARYVAGQAALQLGDLKRALAEYREATRISEEATDAPLAMARIYFSLHQYQVAGQFAERHIRSHPFESPDAHVIAIRSAIEQAQWKKAEALLENLNAQQGMKTTVVVEHAGLLRKKDGEEAAANIVENSLIDLTDPANAVALTSLALDLIALGQPERALTKVDGALGKHPDAPPLLDIRARILARMGRSEEALAAVAKALVQDPDFAPALEVSAMYAEQGGRLEEALEHYDRAAAGEPENPEYAYHASRLTLQLGRADEGIDRLRKVVSLSPGHVSATNDLAWHLAESGKELDLALDLASRAIQLSRGAETLDTLGWVQFKRGDVDAALNSFQAALEDRPDSPSVRYRMALALARKGDASAARENLSRALEIETFPEVQAARAELARLENH